MAASVKTAISIREDLFKEVNKLAEELHVSRSKLFVMAVQDYLKKNNKQSLLSQINRAFNDYPDSEELEIHSKMRKKQVANLARETW